MLGSAGNTAESSGWNPNASLRCLSCGEQFAVGPMYDGCPACADGADRAPVEVEYEVPDPAPDAGSPAGRGVRLEVALDHLTQHYLPLREEARVRLGRPLIPLVPLASLGAGLFLKNETVNPTWGQKDRLHEMGVGAARLLDARGVVATSTGNHGAAAAAHATAAGLPCVIFCHPTASTTAVDMIKAYGGIVMQGDPRLTKQRLSELVDRGWFPATSLDPAIGGRSNPYGAEGYKELSYEVAAQLGRLPDAVIVPTASGDTYYGVAKGFAELSRLTGQPQPLMVAAQPTGANPLVRSIEAGRSVEVADAHSIALSVADPVSGRQAIAAVQRWNGHPIAVSDDAIWDATRRLARLGYLLEPASAVPLAAYDQLVLAGVVGADQTCVLVGTGSGAKWPSELHTWADSPTATTEMG